MKGRKPIPNVLKLLRGNPGRRPINDEEPKPPPAMPPCPPHMSAVARREWRRAGKVLLDVGLLSDLDMAVLAAYCQSYADWVMGLREVKRNGMVVTVDGVPRLNLYVKVGREAFDRMVKAAVLLGLSPSSRATLKVRKAEPDNKIEAFLSRKTNKIGR